VGAEPALKHARIIEFNASDTRIQPGTQVHLCYSIADAEQAFLNKRPVPIQRNCVDFSPRSSTDYVLTAVGEDKQPETRTIKVEVSEGSTNPSGPAVRITRFIAKRATFKGMQLCYTIENAVSANIEPEFGTVKKPSQDCLALRVTEPTTYTLTARGRDGQTDQKTYLYTPPEPVKEMPIRIISFSPETQTINSGASARICYSTLGEGTAQISPEPGSVPPSILGLRRCVTVSPRESTGYTLTVTSSEGKQDRRSVRVIVQHPGSVIQ
jgi:hypothetical protein